MPKLYFIPEIMKFLVYANFIFIFASFAVKYKGRDDTIVGRTVDQAVNQVRAARGAKAKSS